MSGQEAEILPYHHPALPVDLANEISDILSVYGLGDVAMEPQATYQSLPSSPPSRRAGLEDVYLFSRVGKVDVTPGPVPQASDFDALLLVSIALSIHVPPWLGGPDEAAEQARLRATARNIVDTLNGRWVASGKTAGTEPEGTSEFSRCLVHFRLTIVIEGREASDGPFAGPIVPETSEAGPVACVIYLSRAAAPRTGWKTDAGHAELGTGSDFALDVPLDARSRITIQNLKSRIDQYHACDALQLSERMARIREIRTGALAFLELEGEIGESWALDTALPSGEYPAEKEEIEEGIQCCREAREGDLAKRLELLENLRACCMCYRASDMLKRGWRASPFTVEIDSALIAYEDLPPTSHRERIGALEVLQSQCAGFNARALSRNRYFYRHLHRLVPEVEALVFRAKKARGEIALYHGIARLIEAIDLKMEELGVLLATRALATRATAVKRDLEAQMNSVVLVVEYGDEDDPVDTLDCVLREHLPALFGIEKAVEDIVADDLLPLVRRVLPVGSEIMPLI